MTREDFVDRQMVSKDKDTVEEVSQVVWDRREHVCAEEMGRRALVHRKETAKRLRAMFNGKLY